MKFVYSFKETAQKKLGKDLLGGKGAGLARMTEIGLPVPPGFTITTAACQEFQKKNSLPNAIWQEAKEQLKTLEKGTGKKFGSPDQPLLVSVRSGAAISMPGMMDTVLNLGLNEETLRGLIKNTQNERFAYDAYRRFIQMFANIVMNIPLEKFEKILEQQRKLKKAKNDSQLTVADLKEIIKKYLSVYQKETGEKFPQNPLRQLKKAIEAVFKSWNNKRAIDYRRAQNIPDDLGTAVNVQTMVFGNMGNDSATGVAFTRNPSTGEPKFYGEFLINAQGEDVVAGLRTPESIEKLKEYLPAAYKKLKKIAQILEKEYRDMQDIEFTIERGNLWMLQTRTGKRTAEAAVRIAYEMAKEKLITRQEAVKRISPEQIDQLLHPRLDPQAKIKVIARGLAASPGAATGKAVFDAQKAEDWGKRGEEVILVRPETSPDDIHGVLEAQGVLTVHGGMTSHAAVVARGLGKPCVSGCETIKINLKKRQFQAGKITVKEGEVITLNGSRGEVILGAVPTIEPTINSYLKNLLNWADKIAKLKVRANADYPRDAEMARRFGAQGIGLCRTEHMFMEQERLPFVQAMILAKNEKERKEPLRKIGQFQKKDFLGLFRTMNGWPVIIRLIDPPLHEFLPKKENLLREIEKAPQGSRQEKKLRKLLEAVEKMHEQNPMLGLRGCRLGIIMPDIIRMQTRAILEAALKVKKEGKKVKVKIMVPLVNNVRELEFVKKEIIKESRAVFKEKQEKIAFNVGTMIELPRAALTADEIAKEAEFFSFGTNDLTQTTLGISRDDAEGKFLAQYQSLGIIKENPFKSLDQNGVGKLVKMGVEQGRQTKPNLEIGICGEHGGDPKSIAFCHRIKLDYVSCSPFRVPIARLAAAHAALEENQA